MTEATLKKPIYLTYDDVAARWRCHKSTAIRRLTLAGFPVMRFNEGSHQLVKLSDLETFEKARVETLQYEDDPPRRVRKYRRPHYLKKKPKPQTQQHAAAS
jgi:hypothetical protein